MLHSKTSANRKTAPYKGTAARDALGTVRLPGIGLMLRRPVRGVRLSLPTPGTHPVRATPHTLASPPLQFTILMSWRRPADHHQMFEAVTILWLLLSRTSARSTVAWVRHHSSRSDAAARDMAS